jgi:LPXTG-motif cell wall-anchored protein
VDVLVTSKNKAVAVVGAASLAVGVALVLLLSPSAASAACDPADFTVDGEFDIQGYLACEAAAGGGLPATGSQSLQMVGLALAVVIIGIAALVIAKQQRRSTV